MRVLLVIPARGGSKGIPGKNLVQVCGLSLVARTVLTARQFVQRVGLRDAVVLVDTDSQEIADEAKRWGAWVPFLRPPELATDTTPTSANVRLVIERLSEQGGTIDAVVLLQPTSPLRTVEDVEACWRLFDPPAVPSVVSVSAYHHPVEYALRRAPDGTVCWASGAAPRSSRRQDFESLFTTDGAVYVGTTERFIHGPLILPEVTRTLIMPANRSLDLDTPDDVRLVRAVAAHVPVTPLRLGRRWIGPGTHCLVIVDVPLGRATDPASGHRQVDAVVTAGAEAVRLTAWHEGGGGWTPGARCQDLIRYAADVGLAVVVEVHEAAEVAGFAETDVAAFSASAGAIEAGRMCTALATSGKPLLCRMDGAGLAQLSDALEAFRADGGGDAAVLCETPTPGAVATARFALQRPTGWWSSGRLELCVAALATGADILGVALPAESGSADGGARSPLAHAALREIVEGIRRAEAALPVRDHEEAAQRAAEPCHA